MEFGTFVPLAPFVMARGCEQNPRWIKMQPDCSARGNGPAEQTPELWVFGSGPSQEREHAAVANLRVFTSAFAIARSNVTNPAP